MAVPCLLIWRLSGRLHAVHHCVVLQGEALLKGEEGALIYACQPWYCRAVPDRSVVSQMHRWDS